MTEAEWLACTNYDSMFTVIRNKASSRKLRLFAVACCRFVWDSMPNEECRQLVLVAESYADGLTSVSELMAAAERGQQFDSLEMLMQGKHPHEARAAAAACFYQAIGNDDPTNGALGAAWSAGSDSTRAASRHEQTIVAQSGIAERLRDIFGNPFRPVTFTPAWRTNTAIALARQMYESRDFGAMPILADALQDAGCDNDDILAHCRGDGPHVRGCWVVDLVLGKE